MVDSAEQTLREAARQHLRRNYLIHVIHGMFGQTGFRLIQAPTFVPAYVHALSGSDWVVGLARGLQGLGMFLSPLLGASVIEHRRRVLPTGLFFGTMMRLQVLVIVLAGFFLPERWNLVAVCAGLGLFGFFLGMQGVAFNVLVSKLIPLERRGVLMGLRNALSMIPTVAVALWGGQLVAANVLGNGYATTFLVAFVLTSLGLVVYAGLREPESPVIRDRTRLRERLRQLPALLRSDREFTRYFLARALGTAGRMSLPFYYLFAAQRLELAPGEGLGLLTAAFMLAQGGFSIVWGSIADRRGFRFSFLLALVVWMASALLLLQTQSFSHVVWAYLLLGIGLGGFMLCGQNMVLEFGSRRNLPMRIAVANSTADLVGAIGPLAGGLLAAVFSYPLVIWVAIGFKLLAFIVTAFFVREPRHRSA